MKWERMSEVQRRKIQTEVNRKDTETIWITLIHQSSQFQAAAAKFIASGCCAILHKEPLGAGGCSGAMLGGCCRHYGWWLEADLSGCSLHLVGKPNTTNVNIPETHTMLERWWQ